MNLTTILVFTCWLVSLYFGLGSWLNKCLPSGAGDWRFFELSVLGVALSAVAVTVGYFYGLSLSHLIWILGILSALGSVRFLSSEGSRLRGSFTWGRAMLAGSAILCLLMAPLITGGVQFALFQGNHHDTFNYLEGAATYSILPKSVLTSAPSVEVVNSGGFTTGPWELGVRPTISILYGCLYLVTPKGFLGLHYVFLVYFLFLSAGILAQLARHLLPMIRGWLALVLGGTVVGGFWGQYTIDINSWSQTGWMPLQLLIVLMVVRELEVGRENENAGSFWTPAVVLAVCVVGGLYIYPEGLLFFLPAVGAIVALSLNHTNTRRIVVQWVFISAVLVLSSVPVWSSNVIFIRDQFRVVASTVDWWKYFQAFLFGMDGLNYHWWPNSVDGFVATLGAYFICPVASVSETLRFIWRLALAVWSSSLIYCLVYYLIRRGWRSGTTKTVLITAVMIIEAAAIALRGQYWTAGKALSFTAPLLVFLIILPPFDRSAWKLGKANTRLLAAPLFLILTQVGFACYRIRAASHPSGIHYAKPYPAIQGDVLKTSFNFGDDSFLKQLRTSDQVAVRISNPWTQSFVKMQLIAHRIPFHLELPIYENRYSEKVIGSANVPRPAIVRLTEQVDRSRLFPAFVEVTRIAEGDNDLKLGQESR